MNENGVRLLCFDLCGEKFAFDMENLVEIVQTKPSEIIPFFASIPIIRGRWDYRGTLIHIIDLRAFFGLDGSRERVEIAPAASSHSQPEGTLEKERILQQRNRITILVVTIQGHIFGLLADAVLQVFPLIAFYEYPNMISKLPRRYFAGVTAIQNELVILLAIEELISNYELDTLLRGMG